MYLLHYAECCENRGRQRVRYMHAFSDFNYRLLSLHAMKKILITGASGYLAHRLLPIAQQYGDVTGISRNSDQVYAGAHQALSVDITNEDALHACISQTTPDVIIHAAAANPGSTDAEMSAVNHLATASIGKFSREIGARLVAVSTDMVFSGDTAPYDDHSQPNPVNEYGRTKAAGEAAVMDYAAVVRTSLIYGLELMDRGTAGFVTHLQGGNTLKLFNDVLRQPVWVDSLAHALCRLGVEHTDIKGVVNVVGDSVYSRADFALMMLKFWDVDITEKVELVSGVGIAGLPIDLRKQCARARQLGYTMPGVEKVLAQVAEQ